MSDRRLEKEVRKDIGLRRFPRRTLLLMILALICFVRLWCVSHPRVEEKPRPVDVQMKL